MEAARAIHRVCDRLTQLAEGVDDATWLHHLRQQDYSTWIRDAIKDDPLADIVLAVEQRADLSPGESRVQILDAIHAKYTAPR